MKMTEHLFTIGLHDKDTEKQEIATADAKNILADMLIEKYGVFAFTMLDCNGVYKMQSTGAIVKEPSIRIEIATTEADLTKETVYRIIEEIKQRLNQEFVMYKSVKSEIDFI